MGCPSTKTYTPFLEHPPHSSTSFYQGNGKTSKIQDAAKAKQLMLQDSLDRTFVRAAQIGNFTLLKSLKGANVNGINKIGRTALHYAVERQDHEMFNFLQNHGADVNVADFSKISPLDLAVKSGKPELVHMVLEAGARILQSNCSDEKISLKDFLVEHKPSNCRNRWTTFCSAVGRAEEKVEYREIVKLLIASEKKRGFGLDGLAFVAGIKMKKQKFIQWLLDEGYTPNQKIGAEGNTPLHVLSDCCEKRAVKPLVSLFLEKIDKEERNSKGLTPLAYAAKKGSLVVIKEMLAKNADIEAKNRKGRTPLHLALRNGNYNAAKYLITSGADLKAESLHKETAANITLRGLGAGEMTVFLEAHGVIRPIESTGEEVKFDIPSKVTQGKIRRKKPLPKEKRAETEWEPKHVIFEESMPAVDCALEREIDLLKQAEDFLKEGLDICQPEEKSLFPEKMTVRALKYCVVKFCEALLPENFTRIQVSGLLSNENFFKELRNGVKHDRISLEEKDVFKLFKIFKKVCLKEKINEFYSLKIPEKIDVKRVKQLENLVSKKITVPLSEKTDYLLRYLNKELNFLNKIRKALVKSSHKILYMAFKMTISNISDIFKKLEDLHPDRDILNRNSSLQAENILNRALHAGEKVGHYNLKDLQEEDIPLDSINYFLENIEKLQELRLKIVERCKTS